VRATARVAGGWKKMAEKYTAESQAKPEKDLISTLNIKVS
jgi:hypothetical protein